MQQASTVIVVVYLVSCVSTVIVVVYWFPVYPPLSLWSTGFLCIHRYRCGLLVSCVSTVIVVDLLVSCVSTVIVVVYWFPVCPPLSL